MKETAAFINVSAQNELSRVYDDAVYNKLCQTLDLTREVILAENFEEHRERLSKVSYLFATWGMPALTEKQIGEYLPNLKAVFYAAGTVQGFARPFLNRDVKVFSAWAANAVPVAEFTVAQIVLSGKGYFQGMRRMETGGREAFSAFSHSLPCNYRVKIGILGRA